MAAFSTLKSQTLALSPGEAVACAPLVHEHRVFVATSHGRIFVLDADTGGVVGPPLGSSVLFAGEPGDGMVIAGDLLWIPSRNGELFGIDLDASQVVHRVSIGGSLCSAPMVYQGRIFVTSDVPRGRQLDGKQGLVTAIDAVSGKIAYGPLKVSSQGLRAGPILYEKCVWVVDVAGTVYRIDQTLTRCEKCFHAGVDMVRGQIAVEPRRQLLYLCGIGGLVIASPRRYSTDCKKPYGSTSFRNQPVILGNKVFAATEDGRLYAAKADGSGIIEEVFDAGCSLFAGIITVRGMVILVTADGKVHAIDGERGRPFWSLELESRVVSTPVLYAERIIVIASQNGVVNFVPWHGGKREEAAGRLKNLGNPESIHEAATLWAEARCYDKSAEAFELYARKSSEEQAVSGYCSAAVQWQFEGDHERERACLIKAKEAGGKPFLMCENIGFVNKVDRSSFGLKFTVVNRTSSPACDIQVTVSGMGKVDNNGPFDLAGMASTKPMKLSRTAQPGDDAQVELTITYRDKHGEEQPSLEVEISVPDTSLPTVGQYITNYNGPTIVNPSGDAIIFNRNYNKGEDALGNDLPQTADPTGSNHVGDAATWQRPRFCPNCGNQLVRPYCPTCKKYWPPIAPTP